MQLLTLPPSPALATSIRATAQVFEDPKSQALLDHIQQVAPSEASDSQAPAERFQTVTVCPAATRLPAIALSVFITFVNYFVFKVCFSVPLPEKFLSLFGF